MALAGSTNYSLALTTNDELYAFGRNPDGQLEYGNTTDAHIATVVDSLCDNLTGINDHPDFTVPQVFPNPSVDGIFYLNTEDNITQLIVFDMFGKIVFDGGKSGFSKNVINLSNHQSGFYIVKMESNNRFYSLKLIKQ